MFAGKKIIAVGGGKGGVGKSVVACNLAVGFAQAGKDVVLVDADLGAPNLHTLLGIERPTGSIGDLLGDRGGRLSEALTETAVPGLRLACGAAPILGIANPEFQKKQRLIREISQLDTEILVVDIGAGVSYNVIDFFNAADLRLVVVTPQITSMHNAYGFIKSSLHRLLQRAIAGKSGYHELFQGGGWSEEKMEALLQRVTTFDPRYLSVFEPLIDSFSVVLIGNMLEQRKESNVLWAMQRMVRDFLMIDCQVGGSIQRSTRVQRSVNQRRPFMLETPLDDNGLRLQQTIAYLQRLDIEAPRQAQTVAIESARYLPKQQASGQGSKGSADPKQLDEGIFAEEILDRRRGETRYPQDKPLFVKIDGVARRASLVDISRSGARITDIPELSPENQLELRLQVSTKAGGQEVWAWIPATVRYYDRRSQAAGCQFQNPEAARFAVESASAEHRQELTPLPFPGSDSAVGGL